MRVPFTAQIEEGGRRLRPSSALVSSTCDLRSVEPEPASGNENAAALLRLILVNVERLAQLFSLVPLLIAQTGRCTSHLTVEMAALALGVSTKTIRRRIREKKLVLETIPGTRVSGIRIDQLFRDWLPIELARRIAEDELREVAAATGKDHR
jgi:hypothetical protein